MNKRIVVKEIDKFVSVTDTSKVAMEYIVYIMVGEIKVKAYTVIGIDGLSYILQQIPINDFKEGEWNEKVQFDLHDTLMSLDSYSFWFKNWLKTW